MSKQVDFYLIANEVNDAKYKLASRLANKLLKLKQKTLILTANSDATESLDNHLWSFSGTSFVAHDKADPDGPSFIHIGIESDINASDLENNYAVMINLCESIPVFNHHFQRIAEIIEAQESQKLLGRARYKAYREEGFELKTHNIEL